MFKRSKHNSLSIFIISQDHYQVPKRTIPDNSKIFHILKLNNYRDVQNLYQHKTFNDYNTNCKKRFDSYLVVGDFKRDFIQFTSQIKTEFGYNSSIFHLKRYLLYSFENFLQKAFKFLLFNEMNNKTISDKRYMKHEFYVKQPLQMFRNKVKYDNS